jgi:hypothetical protein
VPGRRSEIAVGFAVAVAVQNHLRVAGGTVAVAVGFAVAVELALDGTN